MMKNSIIFLISCLLIGLSGCNQEPSFKVKGSVQGKADLKDKVIYLEKNDIENVVLLDSVKLRSGGVFAFKQKSPECPEFYRLRLDDKIINFAVDSTEILNIETNYDNFSTGYSISNSENNEKIKELTLLQIDLQQKINHLIKTATKGKLIGKEYEDSLAFLIKGYKDTVKMNYIFPAPYKSYAYFALFQKLGEYLIFDPFNNKEDIKCFGAVATSMNNLYPHADRSKNLYNIVIKGMKNMRTPQQKTIHLAEDKVFETGIIDIKLKDLKGTTHKLSDLKGKVVLLDFIIYQSPISSPHNITLNELYKKYASKGFEIYQVSLDADEHFWKTTSDKLPWLCVRDKNGIYSTLIGTYNIQKLPSYFLINRNNELINRDEGIKNLEEEIKNVL